MNKQEVKVPADFQKALTAAPKVMEKWLDLTPLARRDFIIWIEQTKEPETRKRRIKVSCSKLMAGQRRPCCFTIIPTNLYKGFLKNPKAKTQWKDLDANERRDFVSWMGEPEELEARKRRIEKAVEMMAAGKRHP